MQQLGEVSQVQDFLSDQRNFGRCHNVTYIIERNFHRCHIVTYLYH